MPRKNPLSERQLEVRDDMEVLRKRLRLTTEEFAEVVGIRMGKILTLQAARVPWTKDLVRLAFRGLARWIEEERVSLQLLRSALDRSKISTHL